jgi:hypothetical protein
VKRSALLLVLGLVACSSQAAAPAPSPTTPSRAEADKAICTIVSRPFSTYTDLQARDSDLLQADAH